MYFNEDLDHLIKSNGSLADISMLVFHHLKEYSAKQINDVIKQEVIASAKKRGLMFRMDMPIRPDNDAIVNILPNLQILGSGRGGYEQKGYAPTPAPTDPRETFIIFSFMVEGYGLMEAIAIYLNSDYVIEQATADITLKQLKTKVTDKCIEWEKDSKYIVAKRETEAVHIIAEAERDAKDIKAVAYREWAETSKRGSTIILDAERFREEQCNLALDIVDKAEENARVTEDNLKAKIYELTSELNELENLLGQYGIVRRIVKWNKVFKRKKQEALFSLIETLTVEERNELNDFMSQYPEYAENESS